MAARETMFDPLDVFMLPRARASQAVLLAKIVAWLMEGDPRSWSPWPGSH